MSSSSNTDPKSPALDVSEVSGLSPIESYPPDDGPLTDLQIAMIRQLVGASQGEFKCVRTTLLAQEE